MKLTCKARTKDGGKCMDTAVLCGYCMQHYVALEYEEKQRKNGVIKVWCKNADARTL